MRLLFEALIICGTSLYGIHDLMRKKYEVFGLVVDPVHGGMAVDMKRFRTRKRAMEHHFDCMSRYGLAQTREL